MSLGSRWDALRLRWNPHLITTVDGLRDPTTLTKREGVIDNDIEYTTWTEYWDGERLVHRSAHVTLKTVPQFAQSDAGGFA